jgi:hypothetical protein
MCMHTLFRPSGGGKWAVQIFNGEGTEGHFLEVGEILGVGSHGTDIR